MPIVRKADGSIHVYDVDCIIDGVDCSNGLKLREHSYWSNPLSLGINYLIYKNPMQIAWVGDYADDDAKTSVIIEKTGDDLYKMVWCDERIKSKKLISPGLEMAGKFLVNHTKKQYINCDEYYNVSSTIIAEKYPRCIYPLSLLTALGNGMGGGDYHGTSIELVGTWAWNVISLEDNPPEGYELFTITDGFIDD